MLQAASSLPEGAIGMMVRAVYTFKRQGPSGGTGCSPRFLPRLLWGWVSKLRWQPGSVFLPSPPGPSPLSFWGAPRRISGELGAALDGPDAGSPLCSSDRSGRGRRALRACPLPRSLPLPRSREACLLRGVAVAQRPRPGLRRAGPGWGGVDATSGLSLASMKPQKPEWGGGGSPEELWIPVRGNPGQVGTGLGSDSES